MPRLVLFLPVALLVAACGQEATPTAPVPPATAPPDAIAAPSPIAEPTETVRTYFMRIQAKDYAGAWSMWGDGGAASGMTEEAFTRSFDRYETFVTDIGGTGPVEGAAGSLYAEVPVHVHGRLKTGQPFNMEGPIRLRRVNDVPGATPEQLRWHIVDSGVRPRPEGSAQSFWVGRWAANANLCQGGAWDFTIGGVSTAGEVSCTFERLRDIPGGVEADATCIAQAPPEAHTIRLIYAQPAQALRVEGGPFADIALVRCEP